LNVNRGSRLRADEVIGADAFNILPFAHGGLFAGCFLRKSRTSFEAAIQAGIEATYRRLLALLLPQKRTF
jgi:hypothetical protein